MSILITIIVYTLSLLVGKRIFKKWINHLFLYSTGWAVFIILYEIKLLRYIELSSSTYWIIIITQIGILSGALSVYLARKVFNKGIINYSTKVETQLLNNNYNPLKYLILFTAIIGFISAFQHWWVLIHKFGSITAVLIQANIIYRMRVSGEIEGVIPYLFIFPYAGIVLGGIYTAFKRRISFIAFLPLLAIILKDIASVGRGGIFVGFLLFALSFFLFRYSLPNDEGNKSKGKKSLIISSFLFLTIVIGSVSFVKTIRGSVEDYKGKSRTFNELKDVPFISPSMYLYFSSNIGIFSKYFELQSEKTMFGENTFLPIYNILSKFEVCNRPNAYPRGYNIPMWSNSATYLKDLHADFGPIGLFAFPFLISLLATYFWFKFYETGKITTFIILVYINSLIGFSIFFMISRAAFWFLSFLFLMIIIPVMEKMMAREKKIIYMM